MDFKRMQQLAGLITEGKELRDYDGDDNYDSTDDVEELTKELNNLYWLDEEEQKYDGDEYAYYIDGNTYVYLLGDAVILEYVDDEGDEIEKYRCADIEEMAEYIVNSYHGLNETTMVTKSTDSSQVTDIARREKTDTATIQSAVNQAKQTGKPVNINETFKKKMRKSEFKQFLKEEVKASLGGAAPQQVNEMAAIKGDIKTRIDQLIEENPEMEVPELSRLIMKDAEINTIIDNDNLSDMAQNQTQKYIRLARGERELQQRGRKADPNKPAAAPKPKKTQTGPTPQQMVQDLEGYDDLDPEDAKWKGKFDKLSNAALKDIWSDYFSADAATEAPQQMNEMAKISGSLESAIKAVIEKSGAEGLALKKEIKADADVIAALGGDTLYDNQLNKFIALQKGDRELQQRGRKAGGENKPKDPTSIKDLVDSDDDTEIEDNWNKVDTEFDNDVDDDKVDAEAAALAAKSSIGKESSEELKAQETKKFWKSFIGKMKEEGIISADNKPVDKEALEAKRKEAQKDLAIKLKSLK